MARPHWDTYFSKMAQHVSTRSTCLRAQVGAVVVRDNRILTTGYNGSPPGLPHCLDVGCQMEHDHCVRTLHAETNAIAQAALEGISLKGSNLYCTHKPCLSCAKLIVSVGIKHVIYINNYGSNDGPELIWDAGATAGMYSLDKL